MATARRQGVRSASSPGNPRDAIRQPPRMTIESNETPQFFRESTRRVGRKRCVRQCFRLYVTSCVTVLIGSVDAATATSQARPAPAAATDAGLLQRMLDAEDSRAPDSASLAAIVTGLRSTDVATRRIAARAIGRIERRENLSLLEPMLTDPSPVVRAEALNAVAQI